MLPVLTRFNGQPAVSPDGQIMYHFPDLQIKASQRRPQPVPTYLEESKLRLVRLVQVRICSVLAWVC